MTDFKIVRASIHLVVFASPISWSIAPESQRFSAHGADMSDNIIVSQRLTAIGVSQGDSFDCVFCNWIRDMRNLNMRCWYRREKSCPCKKMVEEKASKPRRTVSLIECSGKVMWRSLYMVDTIVSFTRLGSSFLSVWWARLARLAKVWRSVHIFRNFVSIALSIKVLSSGVVLSLLSWLVRFLRMMFVSAK